MSERRGTEPVASFVNTLSGDRGIEDEAPALSPGGRRWAKTTSSSYPSPGSHNLVRQADDSAGILFAGRPLVNGQKRSWQERGPPGYDPPPREEAV